MDSRPEELVLLFFASRLWRGCFVISNEQICAVLAALNRINYIAVIMPQGFVLTIEKFLPQHVARLEVKRDVY